MNENEIGVIRCGESEEESKSMKCVLQGYSPSPYLFNNHFNNHCSHICQITLFVKIKIRFYTQYL